MKPNFDKVLFLVALLSLYVMVVSSPEPVWLWLDGSAISSLLKHSDYETLFTVSSGIVVSYAFYLIVVYFPAKQRKLVLKKQMCNQLTFLMTWSKPRESSQPLIPTYADLELVLGELKENKRLTDIQPQMVKLIAQDNLDIFIGLIPVAAEIGEAHLEHWCNATKTLRSIANIENEYEDDGRHTYRYLIYFFEHILAFKQLKI